MLRAIFTSLFFASFSLFSYDDYHAHGADVVFDGEGVWDDNFANHGHYQVHVEFYGNEIHSDYHSDEEGDYSTTLTFFFYDDFGNFNVLDHGFAVGEGFCRVATTYPLIQECQYYYFDYDNIRNDETITYGPGFFHRVGFKTFGGVVVRWDEALNEVDFYDYHDAHKDHEFHHHGYHGHHAHEYYYDHAWIWEDFYGHDHEYHFHP